MGSMALITRGSKSRLLEENQMKRNFRLIAVSSLSALALWVAHVGSAMAANPTEMVVLQCMETSTGYTVQVYDASSGAPGKSSSDCAAAVQTVLNAGLTNVNVSVQTYTATSGMGAPGQVDGTYATYVLTNGTLAGGNL